MELFVVDRYLGYEGSKKVQENDHLAKLLEKVEQRKKLKKSLEQQPDVVNDATERASEQRKKLKKSLEQQTEVLDDGTETASEQQKKLKKSVEDQPKVLNDGTEKASEKKKRRKRKHKSESNVNEVDKEEESDRLVNQNISNEEISHTSKEEVDSDVQNENEIDNEPQKHESDKGKLLTKTSENKISEFTVIGDHKFKKKKEVQRVLPEWLAKPTIISTDLKNLTVTVDDIPEFDRSLVEILKRNNVSHFFPIQAELIPFLLKMDKQSALMWPNDVCVSAPTGSGKTFAFVLPIVQILQKKFNTCIRALVVLPVQELAVQVARVFETYTAHTKLRVVLTTGGRPFQAEQKMLVRKRFNGEYESLADILVTTPGRLVEHLVSTEGFTLKHLRFLVIDEADRVMDRIQNDWLYYCDKNLSVPGCPVISVKNLTTLPKRPQRLLFSATLSVDPEKLSQLKLMQPKLFTSVVPNKMSKSGKNEFIGQYTTPAELTEYMTECDLQLKPLVLYHLLDKNNWNHVLIFTMSREAAHKLAIFLHLISAKTERHFRVAEISSDFSTTDCDKILSEFSAGNIDILISTDILARGIDIPDVRCVISYDKPKALKNYIHRVGRTGRAGKDGTAVTILTSNQIKEFEQSIQKKGKEISELLVHESDLAPLESVYQETLVDLKSHIEREMAVQIENMKAKRKQSEKVFPKKKLKKIIIASKTKSNFKPRFRHQKKFSQERNRKKV